MVHLVRKALFLSVIVVFLILVTGCVAYPSYGAGYAPSYYGGVGYGGPVYSGRYYGGGGRFYGGGRHFGGWGGGYGGGHGYGGGYGGGRHFH
jgi:hypothetical protein